MIHTIEKNKDSLMSVFYCILMFSLGLLLLVSGSSLFVDSAVFVAKKLNVPEILIGATIVSLGTTLPEIIFSVSAAFSGKADMALGNALGSILCNTGLIAGILILVRTTYLSTSAIHNIKINLAFLCLALMLYFLSGHLFSSLISPAGWVLVTIGIFYLQYSAKCVPAADSLLASKKTDRFTAGDLIRLILESVIIFMGAQFLLIYGPELAAILGVPDSIISLTFVAAGTSLPELVTSFISLKKNHASLSLGNLLGADILNLVFVGGLSSLITPLPFSSALYPSEYSSILCLIALLCVPTLIRGRTSRIQGFLLLSGYLIYLHTIT